jgi:hypothetical protein
MKLSDAADIHKYVKGPLLHGESPGISKSPNSGPLLKSILSITDHYAFDARKHSESRGTVSEHRFSKRKVYAFQILRIVNGFLKTFIRNWLQRGGNPKLILFDKVSIIECGKM